MPIEFIPNQPIIFTDNSQSCLNNDNKAYAQMMQPDDMMCVQMKQDPCSYEQMCTIVDPETNWTTNPDFSGDASGWTLVTGWAYGTNNIIYTGAGFGKTASQTMAGSITAGILGNHFKITINVSAITGKLLVYVSESQVASIDAVGLHTFYHTARTYIQDIYIVDAVDNSINGTFTVEKFDVELVLDCFEWYDNGNLDLGFGKVMNTNPDFTGNATGWDLQTSWAYNTNKITKTPSPGLARSAAQHVTIDAKQAYRVGFTISDYTAGSLVVSYGNNTIASISANGYYEYDITLYQNIGLFAIDTFAFLANATFSGSIESAYIIDPFNHWIINNDGELCKSRTDLFPIVSTNTPANIGGTGNITFEINNRTLGTITPQWGTTNGLAVSGNGTFSQYINAAANGELIFIEDLTFDGCIGLISAKEMNLGSSFTIISADGTTDISDHYNNTTIDYPVIYDNEYITWCIKLSDLTLSNIPVNLPRSCYRIMFTDDCASIEYISDTLIHYSSTDLPCTRMVIGSNTGEQFGFNWNDFIMYQRLKVLRITPEHKIKGEDYFDSRGEGFNAYIEADKQWVAWFDLLDENTHDALSIQLYSNNFSIDTVPYFCPIQDIQPLWAANMKRNLAQLKVELRKKVGKLFKKLS